MKRSAMGAMALLVAASSFAIPSFASADPRGRDAQYERNDHDNRSDRDYRNDRDYRGDRGDRGNDSDRWDDSRHNGYRYKGKFHYGPPPSNRRDHVSYEYQTWRKGDRLPAYYRERYREVDYRSSRLKAPPRGYHYVRDDRGETLLVGIATGAILGVLLSQ